MKMRLTIAALALLFSAAAPAQTLKMAAFSDNTHAYYHALLVEALAAAQKPVTVERRLDVPQPRIGSMLEDGSLDVHWFVQSPDRDQKFVGVAVPLTNGLIGQRVLLIRPVDQDRFAAIQSVADLKASGLVGGFGQGWFDVAVWKANSLPVMEQAGEWRTLYKMVAAGDRKVDYFSRGVTEIGAEAAANPDLAIEKNLLLVYDRDFRFYLSQQAKDYAAPLAEGLARLQQNGKQAELLKTHFGAPLSALGMDTRRKLVLTTP